MTTHLSLRHLSRRLAKHVVARLDRNLITLVRLGLQTQVSPRRQEIGRKNEEARDDLMMCILDYNRIADQNLDLLIDLARNNGHSLPEGLDLNLLRNHFRNACEASAINLMSQPVNNPDMFKDMERVMGATPSKHTPEEATVAGQLLRTLLGGRTPSETNA